MGQCAITIQNETQKTSVNTSCSPQTDNKTKYTPIDNIDSDAPSISLIENEAVKPAYIYDTDVTSSPSNSETAVDDTDDENEYLILKSGGEEQIVAIIKSSPTDKINNYSEYFQLLQKQSTLESVITADQQLHDKLMNENTNERYSRNTSQLLHQEHIYITNGEICQSLPFQSHTDNNCNISDGRRRKQTVSIFDVMLVLSSFDKYEFPLRSADLLENKNAEFHAEYKSFLNTQSQIYDLKLEHIKNQNSTASKFEYSHQQLAKSMQDKIDTKRKELTGKWDEFVADQKEINDLKQQILQKRLLQFAQQIHFEQQNDFIEIMNSNKINNNTKEEFKNHLKDFREQMLYEYSDFRDKLYNKYENKLKDIENK